MKVGAVALAAMFGVFVPGIGPLSLASAQEAAQEQQPPWAPVGTPGAPPEDTGKPDKVYVPEIACITSGTEGREAFAANALKEAPPAQRLLRLNEVHNYVRRHSPAGKVGADKDTGKALKVAVIDTGVTPHV
ncbi:MAG: serine protease, partial [Thermocrispum sp.]